MQGTSDEDFTLRQAFDRMPKIPGHGETVLGRHKSVRKEWVMKVIAEPHERYETINFQTVNAELFLQDECRKRIIG